jgi:hypothetical protein
MTYKDIAIYLLNEQYKLVDLTFEQVQAMPWEEFLTYKINTQQQTEWKEWAVAYLRKKKRWTKKLAQKEVAMLDFQYGLSLDI